MRTGRYDGGAGLDGTGEESAGGTFSRFGLGLMVDLGGDKEA